VLGQKQMGSKIALDLCGCFASLLVLLKRSPNGFAEKFGAINFRLITDGCSEPLALHITFHGFAKAGLFSTTVHS
jgi:hypothetical protein